jgi:hypothetical protein
LKEKRQKKSAKVKDGKLIATLKVIKTDLDEKESKKDGKQQHLTKEKHKDGKAKIFYRKGSCFHFGKFIR